MLQTNILRTHTHGRTDGESGDYIVLESEYCASLSKGWQFAVYIYLFMLLLISSAIATQNRGIRQEFNETRYLTILLYSHFMLVVMRLVLYLLSEDLGKKNVVSATTSLLISIDTLITLSIYFLPKILVAIKADKAGDISPSSLNLRSHMIASVDTEYSKSFTWHVMSDSEISEVRTTRTPSE